MPVYKNEDNGTWYVLTRYLDWKGERKQKCLVLSRAIQTKKFSIFLASHLTKANMLSIMIMCTKQISLVLKNFPRNYA